MKDDTDLFIISHHPDQIADYFDRVLEFSLHNNFTQLKTMEIWDEQTTRRAS
jgi:ABC-type molybdenum transport system ATPase subunit/photorepair protein PhrA